ncbi:TetR/AcrR family transcriptional regulator [Paramicrobacterium humi]|nr:TetR family transcriptional regulator [Microbacterium humi]
MAQRGSYAKGVAKREEILATALEVIARHGYRRTSVRELAEAVGLSQAGLLHYFSSKEELFAEVLRKRDELSAAATKDATPLAILIDAVRHNAEVAGLVRLHTQFSAEATDELHPAHAFFAQRYAELRERSAEAIRQMQDAGELRRDVDAVTLATMTIALTDGLQTQWLLDPSIDMAAHIEALLALASAGGPAGSER